jgi:hypothetical protein
MGRAPLHVESWLAAPGYHAPARTAICDVKSSS